MFNRFLISALWAAFLCIGLTYSAHAAPTQSTTCDAFPGEQCHLRDGVIIFKVNVFDPRYDFDMVMAHEATTADLPNVREFVRDMVVRPEHAPRVPILAINADYFGGWGPEGLTVKNGVRIPNAGRNNVAESVRSSLSIAQDRTLRLGKQTDCVSTTPLGCENWIPDPARYDTTIGGGPLFIDNGRPLQDFAGHVKPCRDENLPDVYCTAARAWSAVGVAADGKTLIIAATPEARPKTMWQMSAILLREGAWRAMKLDSGGSTQLWYRGEELVQSSANRPIANALVLYARPENCPIFCDVWLDNIFFADIKFLRDASIAQGYGDGTFRPNNPISRAETATLIWRWLGKPAPPAGCTVDFPDFPPPESPHYLSLRYLVCQGIMRGFSDGTLRPDVHITRGEVVSLILRTLSTVRPGEDPLTDAAWEAIRSELGRFPDAPGGGVHDDNIARSRWIGLVHGYSDGLFRSDLPVSRGQFAKILTRAIHYGEYRDDIFVPCTIDYAALLSAFLSPDSLANISTVASADACHTPSALEPGPQQLLVSPAAITFTISADGQISPPLQTIDVTVAGVATNIWQASSEHNWLQIEKETAADVRSAMLQLDTAANLPVGVHTAHVSISNEQVMGVSQGSDISQVEIPVTVVVLEHSVAPLAGDVNCDGGRSSVDALFILQFDVGLRSAVSACPVAEQQMVLSACDVNLDGNCTPIDALFLLQCDVGIANAACP